MSGPIGRLAKLARKAVEPIAIKALLARERLESGVSYHPGSAEILADPYPKYAQIRQQDPVHRMRLLDGWALTRYKDSDAVLRDHARFSNAIPSVVREQTGLISMLHQDPPEHTRLRALVSPAFAPRAIEKLRFSVERTAEQLLDAVAGQRCFDLIAALAYPLPITIIADMMGVPPKDMDRTSHLSFGRGIHYCLGASLAEMEGRIVFKTILRRFRSLRLAGEPKRREQISLRGVEELWVEVEAGSDG